ELAALVARMVTASYQKASAAQEQIQQRSRELERKSLALLGACLVLATLCAVLTLRMAVRLFQQVEWQGEELSRVSWQMRVNQEAAGGRRWHELQGGLGQARTAIKANVLAAAAAPATARPRLEDCVQLVDESMRNVRELSQLLRPTILDDFGLDAALRWLA